MSVEDDLKFYFEHHATPEDRERHERNIWIGKTIMGWEFTEDKLHNWTWKTGIMCKSDDASPEFEMTFFWGDRSVDFWNSLDAVAHAEKKIAEMCLLGYYSYELTSIYWRWVTTDLDDDTYPAGRYEPLLATARQRCEALYALRERIEAVRAEQVGQ